MNQRRVVVTGLGVISGIGNAKEEFAQNLFAGSSGIGPIKSVDMTEVRFKNGAEVTGFDENEHFDEKQLVLLERFAQFSVATAREAINDSGIEFSDELRERTAVITGTGSGGMGNLDRHYTELYVEKKMRPRPLSIPRAMPNAGASHISIEFGIHGPTFTTTTACSSSTHAIGQAFWFVRSGLVDVAVTGGSETPFAFGNLKAWEAMRVVSHDTCRPFSKTRSGMILGEGGATLLLEELESAKSRGAHIYAEIVGFGMSADAFHITQPSEQGAAKSMRMALRDGGLNESEVSYVNAHGTATQVNDTMETKALRLVFGDHTDDLAVSSTKSMHGHTLGAAGAIEAVATVLAVDRGIVPPTANFEEADPECSIDAIPNESRELNVAAAISNSFAFGGLNATLAFRRFDG